MYVFYNLFQFFLAHITLLKVQAVWNSNRPAANSVRRTQYLWCFKSDISQQFSPSLRRVCQRASSRYIMHWYYEISCMLFLVKLLATELFFFILAHTVYKMWIIQETNTLELWNKLHFEEKNEYYMPRLKYSLSIFVE